MMTAATVTVAGRTCRAPPAGGGGQPPGLRGDSGPTELGKSSNYHYRGTPSLGKLFRLRFRHRPGPTR